MPAQVKYRKPVQQLEALLAQLPGVLAGKVAGVSQDQARQVLRRGAQTLAELIQAAFITKSRGGTDEAGLRWPPLKNPRRPGRGILWVTGKLYRSLRPGGRGLKIRTGPGWFSVGVSDPKARYHHLGTKTIPARPLWPEPEQFPKRWWQKVGQSMAQALAELASQAVRAQR